VINKFQKAKVFATENKNTNKLIVKLCPLSKKDYYFVWDKSCHLG
jgi:hypothetical protein